MTDSIEKKKVDIYSLYKKEQMIRIEDDENNYIDILMVKITQGERMSILNEYNTYLEEQRAQLQEREEKSHTLALAIERYASDDLINALIVFETAQRNEVIDLYPLLEGKTDAERDKIIKDEIETFKKSRKEELQKESRADLQKRFINMTLESQALLDSIRILNYQSLSKMCLDPDTREKLFKSASDIERICDRRVLDKLIEEMTAFRSFEMKKEIRGIATTDSSFLAVGESQGNSTGSPVTTA